MADLNRYFQSSTVQIDMLDPSAAERGGEAIGIGLRQAGQSVQNIVDRDEDFWVQKTLGDLDKAANQKWSSHLENMEDGAPGFENKFVSDIDTDYQSALSKAPSGRASRRLELAIDEQREARRMKARGFEKEENFQYKARTILNDADDLGQTAMREPGVEAYSPQGRLIPPGSVESIERVKPDGFYTSAQKDEHTGQVLPDNLASFKSSYYAPQDFADGANMSDKSGDIRVSKRLVSALDWVTDQFGMGKLQINSGYRSPSSNLKRASSGADGPHTHGEAVDIQVRDLPKDDKDRLYSLLRSQGFNAFGFGEGVLHAEIREGGGSGRGGDAEWTYGGAKKYNLVPVMTGPQSAQDSAPWKSANQYPYLAMAGMTAGIETGSNNLVEASSVIAPDANGTVSYGIMGLNSGGTLQRFINENPTFGITAKAGTPEFDAQWKTAVARHPQAIVDAQLKFHESQIVRPAQRSLVTAGFGKFSNDPAAVAFVSDMVVQYGAGGVEKHLLAAAGAQTTAEFMDAASESMRSTLDTDFHGALETNPGIRAGLLNRIDKRAREAGSISTGGGATPITGNVPRWGGPLPDINNVPMYAERLNRLKSMVDTVGGTPAQRRAMVDDMENRITRAWMTSVAQSNPSAAMALLQSGKYDSALTIADDASIRGSAEAGWKAYETEIRTAQKQLLTNLQTEAQASLSDEIASISSTGKSLGKLSPAHLAMLTDTDKENLKLAKDQYSIGQDVSTSRNEELLGYLESLKPQGDGFATEQKKYDYAQKLIAARYEKQQSDPAGYALSTSQQLTEQWQKAMASNNPAQVQSAIATMRRVQQSQGVPADQIRSITQTSQENNETLLNKAENPDQAFARFVQLRSVYGGEFGSVLKDMERDGGRQGWAAVGELMDSGNVILAKSLARVVHGDAFKGDAKIGMHLARAGQSAIARQIFDGRVKRTEIKGMEPTGKTDGESVDGILGEILGDSLDLSPSMISDVQEAAKSFYANGAALGEELNGDRLRGAVQAVTGGVLEHNGDGLRTGKFIAPKAGMPQAQFDGMIANIQDKDLKGAYIGNSANREPVTAVMMRDDLQLVSVGNGRYFLRFPNVGLATNERGQNYEFDLMARQTDLTKRATNARSSTARIKQNPAIPGAMPEGGPFSGFDENTGLPIARPAPEQQQQQPAIEPEGGGW